MYKTLTALLLSLLLIFAIFPGGMLTATGSDPTQFQPLLVIEKVNAEKAVVDGYFYLTLVIKNHGEHPAFNVFAQISTPKEKESFFSRVKEANTGDPDLEKIEGGQTRSLTFEVHVAPEADCKDYNLLITLVAQNVFFEEASRSTASINVPVTLELTSPHLTVKDVKLEPKTPGGRETFAAVFYLDNYSSAEARNVTIEMEGMDNFEIADFTNRKFLQAVTRGGNNFVLFKLRALEKRTGNNVKLKFFYEGEKEAEELLVNLPLGEQEPGSSPFVKVKSFSVEETSQAGEFLLKLILENLGQEKAQDLNLILEGGDNIYILHGSNVNHIDELEGKSELVLNYTFGLNPSQGQGHYPLQLDLDYTDRTGQSYDSSETLGISSASLDSSATVAGNPRVLINKYTLSDAQILAGNIVALALFIENTHARPVHNIKVSFGVIQVEGETGGTVFSPVNGSNSFFIQQIPARTTLEKSVDLYVDPNAAAKTYIVPVTIEYEDENATAYSVSEMVNIPVTQECKLQILSLEVPPEAFVGQPAFVGAEFVNVGKVTLNNFIVMLEGDFHKEQASYFVGNLPIGASDFYQGMVFPEEEGTLAGKLIFSYIDHNNKEVQVEEPFEMQVQAMAAMEHYPGEMEPGMGDHQQGGSLKRILLFYVIPLAILSLLGIFLWRRKKKKEKEKEFFDA